MTLHTQEYGKGFPLIILHGLFGSSDNWHTLARRFGEYFRVYTVDLRNHGRSPHDPTHTYEAMSEDLFEFLKVHSIEMAFIVGHSMGGKTAMQFAFDHPALVPKLVVVDIGPKQYPPQHDSIFKALFSVDLKNTGSRGDVEAALARTIKSPVTRQFLMKNLKRTDHGFAWKLNLDAIHRSYDRMNMEITGKPFRNPALFLRSLTSGYVLEEDKPSIRALFPAARFADLNVGHWIHAEAPDKFFQVVLDFLRQTPYV